MCVQPTCVAMHLCIPSYTGNRNLPKHRPLFNRDGFLFCWLFLILFVLQFIALSTYVLSPAILYVWICHLDAVYTYRGRKRFRLNVLLLKSIPSLHPGREIVAFSRVIKMNLRAHNTSFVCFGCFSPCLISETSPTDKEIVVRFTFGTNYELPST